MRTTRAYLAGFGTAGSLLAAAAVLFIVASAAVSFRGFPEISAGAPAAQIDLPGATAHPGVGAATPSRRVLLAFAGAAAHVSKVGVGRADAATPVAGRSRTPTAATTPTQATVTGSTPVRGTGTTTGSAPSTPITPAAPGSALGNTVEAVGTTLSGTVAGTGQNLSGTIAKTSDPIIAGTSTISKNLGSAVANISDTVTTLVDHTTAGVGTIIANATGTVGKLLGGKR